MDNNKILSDLLTIGTSFLSRLSRWFYRKTYFTYKIYLSNDLKTGQIYPYYFGICVARFMSSFNMEKDSLNENIWYRKNLFFLLFIFW